MKSKTIILSSQNNQTNGRGILTLYEENGLLQCKLRLYNIKKLDVYCKIGVYHNNEVISANLLEKNGVYYSSLVGNFDMNQDFFTAIIDTQNNNQVIISGGTYAGFFFNDEKVFNRIEKENPQTDLLNFQHYNQTKSLNLEDVSTPLGSAHDTVYNSEYDKAELKNQLNEENHSDYSLFQQAQHNNVESPNTKHDEPCEDCNKCLNCKYKEYFYSHVEHEFDDNKPCNPECSNNVILSEVEGSPNAKHNEQESLTNSLIPQFQYVFENYEADEILNNLISNGKFVKINENNSQYSIGAIYNEDEMKYICYAVMCDYNSPAPQELGEHYQWLPIDKEDPLSDGYYIVFQDAKDLKIVEL